MPHMNRIRVNNVKYNFGTQQYDDFVMRMHGKNTIYDLANGGGKSVLMLLLLQNLIPNCTLDEKQPVEKLFRTSGGSTTIHSMIEWNLDPCDIKDDYRFMLTGFCARKAKDASDGEDGGRDTAAIDYFNYCIFYRSYNANDLVNFPLVKDGERITYNGLRNYLKELDRNVLDLKVYVFDRKGEYQQFISHYGLYESAWEIIRGINKTEGHVRTYFETNYKTTRKVVEDLLIEEIIEKSFRDRTDKSDLNESMAKTLLDMKDKLMELSEKKNEMTKFEHQKELLHVLAGRVEALSDMYVKKDALSRELLSAGKLLKDRVRQTEQELKGIDEQLLKKRQACQEKEQVIACLKVQNEENTLLQWKEQERAAQAKALQCQKEWEDLKADCAARENGNDYLEYRNIKQQKEEQEKILLKAADDSGEDLDRLYDYAALKKKMMEERLAKTKQQFDAAQKEEKELKVVLKSMMNAKRELECEYAVAQADQARIHSLCTQMKQALLEKKNDSGLLLLEDVVKECLQRQDEVDALVNQQFENAKEMETIKQQQMALRFKEQETKLKLDTLKEQEVKSQPLVRLQQQAGTRIAVLCKTYPVSGEFDENERICEEYLKILRDTIKEQAQQAFSERISLQQKLKEKQSELAALADGAMVTNGHMLAEIAEYIKTRHETECILGQDYILQQEKSKREALLLRIPYLPYGIIVNDVDEERIARILEDGYLKEKMSAGMVPVFSMEFVCHGELHKEAGMFMLLGDETGYYNGQGFQENYAHCEQQCAQMEKECTQFNELYRNLWDDYEFVCEQLLLFDAIRETSSEEEMSYEGVAPQKETLADTLLEFKKEQEALLQRQEMLNGQQEEIKSRLSEKQAELSLFQEMKELYGQWKEYEKQENLCREKTGEKERRLQEAAKELEEKNHFLRKTRERLLAYRTQLEESEAKWNAGYSSYYKEERKALDLGFTEEELDTEFFALKTVVEQGMGSVEDKKALIAALERNMEKMIRLIKRRNGSLEQLQRQYEQNELFAAEEEELSRLLKALSRAEVLSEQAQSEKLRIQKEKSKCEGRVEHGQRVLLEQGIHYTPLDIASQDLERALEEQKQMLQKLQNDLEQEQKRYAQCKNKQEQQLDFCKDVQRIVELYHLKVTEDEEFVDLSDYSMQQLKQCRQEFEKAMKKEEKARREFEEYKQHTAQTLSECKAFELAEAIRKDVVMPETLSEMKELIASLNDMADYITLEQERVEQGISDMQLIKSSFENQCIRRCQDVRTELERLPKLSSITLDGENIQMISLQIPYVSNEQMKQRMSDYIDRIVLDVDQYDTFSERMKFIRNQLALKRLFSVIVTDMNKIRLNLYKRERIKEQSRYLRYEEAVGSTGQSQGIYIQFLIAVINYIANIHSINSDNTDLGKVIFIDNPFGAAKDVYIWEPIFEMLKTNNVQLVVPARGATPAITGRFDVNYILGQKMVDGRQQTVVVDYRSQVEKVEMEYKKVEFTQNSFDFI